jgi:RNase P subunit RPR2
MKTTEVCKKHGHSFVESSLGRGTVLTSRLQESRQTVLIFCQKCGEVRKVSEGPHEEPK